MRIVGILLLTIFLGLTNVDAELIVSGNYWTNKTKQLKNFFHQPDQPTAVMVGDMWEDTETGYIYKWNGSDWKMTKKTAIIDESIQDFKDSLAGVDDPEAKKCLKMLGKVLLKTVLNEDL